MCFLSVVAEKRPIFFYIDQDKGTYVKDEVEIDNESADRFSSSSLKNGRSKPQV